MHFQAFFLLDIQPLFSCAIQKNPIFFPSSIHSCFQSQQCRGRSCHSEFNFNAQYFQHHFLAPSRKVFYNFIKRTNLQLGFSTNTTPVISQTPIHFPLQSSLILQQGIISCVLQMKFRKPTSEYYDYKNVKPGYVLKKCFPLFWEYWRTKFLLTREY